MYTKKLVAAFVFGLGLTLALLWSLEATLVVAAPSANLTVTKFTDSADGACDADCSLREAIIVANGNGQPDTIVLGSGVYTLSLTTGGAYPERGDLDVMSSYALTITGNGPQNTFINANGIDRVIYIHDDSPTVVISGVTMYGGATSNSGGGIDHRGGDLILINVAVVSNTAASSGGGVALTGSDATLTLDEDCLVAGNESGYSGGGIFVSGGARALLGGGRIVSNTAISGGGVYAAQSNVTLSGVQIVSNTASNQGGGAYLYGTATLNGGAILSNTANNSGGGLFVAGAFTQTGQSIIAYNTANERGGGIHLTSGTAILNDGQIIHNRVTSVLTKYNSYGGGGIYVGAGGATLIQTGNHTIAENSAARHGGGMLVEWGKVTLSGGQILSNTAGENGGGVYLYASAALTQTGGLIAYNKAKGTDTYDGGGGLYSSASSNLVSLNGGQIMGNQAYRGGGLCVPMGNLNLLGAEIVGNHATQYGGGVYAGMMGQSTQLEGGRIISNSAEYGGGLYAAQGSVTLERGQIVGNQANVQGGGVYHDTDGDTWDMLTLVNTTISGNSAPDGSALVNASGTTLLTYTTIASNTTGSAGYGILKGTGFIRAKNTIIAYNDSTNCGNSAVTSNDYNLDSDSSCEFLLVNDQSGVDPELAPLDDDLGTLIHAIVPGSPPHDNGVCLSSIPTDQRGVHRLAPCDVGAYEYGQVYTLTMATDGTGTGIVTPSVGAHFYLDGAVVPITATVGSYSTFEGWSGNLDVASNSTSITMDGDKAVIATFDLLTYTLTVATDTPDTGSGTVDPPVDVYVYDYGSTVWLTATADTGSTFLGWEGAAHGLANPVSVTITSDMAITATFTVLPVYTLTVATDGDGTVNPPVGPHSYISGTTVWLTATASAGSTFAGWSGVAISSTNPTSITIDGNRTVTATFDLVPDVYYTLTMAIGGTGVGTVDPPVGAYSYLSGTVVPITATQGQNSVFESWSGNLSGSTNPISITMDGHKAVTAIFSATGCIDLTAISIAGSASGEAGVYTFTTSFEPASATPPIAYLWDNGDVMSTTVRTLEPGNATLMVTATNCISALVTVQHSIAISAHVYLPLMMQSQ